jgi:hypothetical protein
MTIRSKLAIVLAVASLGFASPAFAQSFSAGFGTGNALPFSYRQTDQNAQPGSRYSGLYAMVPSADQAPISRNPADMGGGSVGYDQDLAIH